MPLCIYYTHAHLSVENLFYFFPFSQLISFGKKKCLTHTRRMACTFTHTRWPVGRFANTLRWPLWKPFGRSAGPPSLIGQDSHSFMSRTLRFFLDSGPRRKQQRRQSHSPNTFFDFICSAMFHRTWEMRVYFSFRYSHFSALALPSVSLRHRHNRVIIIIIKKILCVHERCWCRPAAYSV